MEEKKKSKKVAASIFTVLGVIVILTGIGIMLYAGVWKPAHGSGQDPVDVFYATEEEQDVYAWMQYMSDSVAYYESMENMQFYIVFDSDFNAAVVCMHADALKNYQAYMDYFYTEDYANPPEEIVIEGFSQPFESDLKKFVIEGYNALLGQEYLTRTNFEEVFGKYYIQLGRANGSYEIFNIGIYALIAGVALLAVGIGMLYQKPEDSAASNGFMLEAEESHRMRGIIGALLGALLGGVLWAAVGMLGYFSVWIGVLMDVFASTGYKMFSGKDDKFGVILSIVFCLIIVLPATFLADGWNYYKEMNSFMAGSVTLLRALKEYPAYLTSTDSWGRVLSNIGLGYVFIIIGIFVEYKSMMAKKA